MKKILLASAALVTLTGAAMAEVKVTGDGRMGLHYGPDGSGDAVWNFTSRIRIVFTASGETDGGLAFGGSIRADNAVQGSRSHGGNVYISGGFGKLAMGDVNSAGEAAVGDLSGVGLTGLGDYNELAYLGGDIDGGGPYDGNPNLLYTYSAGDFTIYASLSDGEGSDGAFGARAHAAADMVYGVGAMYSFGNYSVALAYEAMDVPGAQVSQIAVGGSAEFGDATIKLIYVTTDVEGVDADADQFGASIDYAFGATTVTAFYRSIDADLAFVLGGADAYYGLGASYDLGGGASLKGGIVACDSDVVGMCDDVALDFGVAMKF